MNWLVNKDQFLGIVRHIVTFVGGLIVSRGKLDPTTFDTLAGVVLTLAGLIWSYLAPEKTLTAEKVIEKLEPVKVAAITRVLAKAEPPKAPLPPLV